MRYVAIRVLAATLGCTDAKRHWIEPLAYLRGILLRLPADDSHCDETLPDCWAAVHPESVLTYRLEESRPQAARQCDRRG